MGGLRVDSSFTASPLFLKGIKVGRFSVVRSPQIIMPFHFFHQVVFFKNSSLYRCTGPVKVNCTTFHHFLQLSEGDQDLHWALGLCFVCGREKHRSECCKSSRVSGRLFCELLHDPHRKSCVSRGCCSSSDSSPSELDCVRPEVEPSSSLWDNAPSPAPESLWHSPSPQVEVAWPPSSPCWLGDSLPSLVSESDAPSSGWVTSLEESVGLSEVLGLVGGSDGEVGQSLLLEGVECDVGEGLMGFVDDVMVRRGDGLELLSQVAIRSAGPPGLAGVSVENPICVQ
jgi:hypothetical protein